MLVLSVLSVDELAELELDDEDDWGEWAMIFERILWAEEVLPESKAVSSESSAAESGFSSSPSLGSVLEAVEVPLVEVPLEVELEEELLCFSRL